MAFDFDIVYKPGASNHVADALSRKSNGDVMLGNLITTSSNIQWDLLDKEVEADPCLSRFKRDISLNSQQHVGFQLIEERLIYKNRVVIPHTSALILELMREYHDSPVDGHSGDLKTYLRLETDWWWQGMRKAVAVYVQECAVCQQNKNSTQSPPGLLQPLPLPSQVWEDVTMDFIEGLPLSKGFDTILVVVDRLTKYAHFLRLKHTFSAPKVAALLISEVVHLHGFPASIVSYRDKV